MPNTSAWPTVLGRTLVTVAIAVAGGFAGNLLGIPAGWLMGSALAVAAAALAGVTLAMPDGLRDSAFLLTGMTMGTNVARDSLELIVQWPVTLAALVIELFIIVAATGYMLRRLFRLDRGTAYLSSFPGHLSFIMGIAAAGVGDPRQITIIQVIRIMMLTVCVPIGALFLPAGSVSAGAAPIGPMTLETLLLVGGLCALTGFVFLRLRIPAAYALGAMAAAMAAKLTGLMEGAMPDPLTIATFVLMGAVIGARFNGISADEFRRAAVGGLIATLMTVGITTIVTLAASGLVDMPFGQIWLGLAPGALEGMGALGIALGFDTAFIAAHHVARLVLLTFAIPVVTLLVREPQPRGTGT